jgi:hypothetical protein
MLAWAERELGMRRRVYPGWVRQGRMAEAKAEAEIAAMQAIADHFRRLVDAEAAKTDLFGGTR